MPQMLKEAKLGGEARTRTRESAVKSLLSLWTKVAQYILILFMNTERLKRRGYKVSVHEWKEGDYFGSIA